MHVSLKNHLHIPSYHSTRRPRGVVEVVPLANSGGILTSEWGSKLETDFPHWHIIQYRSVTQIYHHIIHCVGNL